MTFRQILRGGTGRERNQRHSRQQSIQHVSPLLSPSPCEVSKMHATQICAQLAATPT
jgi:hypothetical protein